MGETEKMRERERGQRKSNIAIRKSNKESNRQREGHTYIVEMYGKGRMGPYYIE